ncbi:MAG: ATP-dependent sacrificial sulfur transferase LarE [Clostridia bacterium]|nr:ATP-dependent sacrificial sulfur transferase LarE [Clostridia bacterium]
MTLPDFFTAHPRAALAFSGGTDSAWLLYAAMKLGADVRPYFVKSQFQPEFELRDAQRLCDELGSELTVIELDILGCEQVRLNPADRCYHCKSRLFSALTERAARDGYALVIDGTNASDPEADRPGMRALREMGVRSPLRECGITKDEVRRLSREAGLFTAGKPSYACLATRIPSGTAITAEDLRRVEGAEDALFSLGFSDLRVRLHSGAARLQLRAEQMPRALERRADILRLLRPYFDTILLDMDER